MRSIALLLLPVLAASCVVGENTETRQPLPPHTAARASALFGLNVQADGARADTVSDLGPQWVRLELVDDSAGAELAPAVAANLGATLDDYHARGMAVLLIVDYASLGGNAGFGSFGACGDWAGWRGAWLARLDHVARVYGARIDAWQIWNEPDHPIAPCASELYNPGIPAADYGRLLRDAYATIRGGGATAPIITGGLDSGQTTYVVQAAAATGGELRADGIAVHPYGVPPDASWCPEAGEDLRCDWGTLGGKVDDYHAISGLPVWITEFGIRTTDTRHAAAYLAAAYTAFESRGARVAHAFFFCESDAMVPPFGLTAADGSPKPHVYAMYRSLSGAAGQGEPPPPGTPAQTMRLHGMIEVGGEGVPGLWVSAWGHDAGDFHVAATDTLGIYAFTELAPGSRYNVVVNAQFEPTAPGGYVALDGAHAIAVRDNVALDAGPDGWHGENFGLAY